ncbi:hypothetical protein [Nocardioides convexus]|uniref:hypothetical protein n=1 Tax=Nocardioides convexus TaxID=2712224 RepID=UPI0024185B8A|nr:hypothetical protein [Nocardioides convexus]
MLLSLRDVPTGGVRPALLLDGPPWLPDDDAPEPVVLPLAAEPAARALLRRPRAGAGGHERRHRRPDPRVWTRQPSAPGARARTTAGWSPAPSSTSPSLRAQASGLVTDLEQDLADARQRVLATLEDASAGLVDSTQSALDQARAEVRRLRAELATATEEGRQAAARPRPRPDPRGAGRAVRPALSGPGPRAQGDRGGAARRAWTHRCPRAGAWWRRSGPGWARRTTAADRERYPWREPVVGPEFLDSLRRVEGIGMDRVHEVCAEVACGRAPDRPGLGVHPLRATDGTGNGSRQRVREDGALAFRASLQVRTAAARRLHYWVLPDGRVEPGPDRLPRRLHDHLSRPAMGREPPGIRVILT